MSKATMDRQRVLRSLLQLDCPLDGLLRDLSGLAWDSGRELVTLRPGHVIEVLNRFKNGTLSAQELENWANAIEGREDIGLEPESRELLSEAVFEFANPALQGTLTTDIAERWIERLSAASVQADRTRGGA